MLKVPNSDLSAVLRITDRFILWLTEIVIESKSIGTYFWELL